MLTAPSQAIQCNANDTPLYSRGNGTSGEGQPRQCRNWDALRKFATKHTACYVDDEVDGPSGKTHFGICDDGTDGLPRTENIGNGIL